MKPENSLRLLAIFLLALWVRSAPLGRYVTPDEPMWVMRSARFADAVAARDWKAIPQTGHPGITTMGLGALGIRLMQALQPAESAEHLAWIHNMAWLAPENSAAFTHLAFFLPAARWLVGGATALGVALAYWLARSRLGERAARLLALFLALDPFFAGLSGLLHTDALQAICVVLAALLVVPKVTNSTPDIGSARALAAGCLFASALCLALAGMTKTLGLLVAPGLAVAMLLEKRHPLAIRLLRVVSLTILTAVWTAILYPVFWIDPRNAIASLVGAVSYHESIGLRDVFFLGDMSPDPGPWFYPAVLFFRLTPPVLVGLIVTVYERIRGRRKTARSFSGHFILPALVYLAALSLATKKFDRYVLTVMLLLAVTASQTWAGHFKQWKWAILASLLLPWVMVAPLPMYYANPLVGGPWLARHIIPLGWGEASGLAAARANYSLPTSSTRSLLTKNVPGAAPFFEGRTRAWQASLIPCADVLVDGLTLTEQGDVATETLHIAGLTVATWCIRTVQFPTGYPLLAPGSLPGVPADAVAPTTDSAALRDWLTQRFPVGTTFTWIHAPACHPLSSAQLEMLLRPASEAEATLLCTSMGEVGGLPVERCTTNAAIPETQPYRARFAGALDLLAASWPKSTQAPDALTVRLRWKSQASLEDASIYLALKSTDALHDWAEGGNLLVDDRIWRASTWDVGNVVDGEAYVALPLYVPPGIYTLTLSLSDAENQQFGIALPDGAFGGTSVVLGNVEVLPPPYPASTLDMPESLDVPFPGLRLVGATPPPRVHWAGDVLPFSLGWERTTGDAASTLHWDLLCDGASWDGGDLSIASGAPNLWARGHRYVTHYAPRTDPLLEDGMCTLRVRVADAEPVAVRTFEVRARERSFDFPQSPQKPLSVTVGNFAHLVGIDAPAEVLASDAALSLSLYWQTQGPADLDYTVFVHVVGPDGQAVAQSDGWPAQGTAPTTSWVQGQKIFDAHLLELRPSIASGNYTLFVGLYDVETGGRVPLYDEAGARLPDDRAPVGMLNITH